MTLFVGASSLEILTNMQYYCDKFPEITTINDKRLSDKHLLKNKLKIGKPTLKRRQPKLKIIYTLGLHLASIPMFFYNRMIHDIIGFISCYFTWLHQQSFS